MTSKTVKRILWELKDYEKNKEENNKNGIYLAYNEENIYKLDLVLVGSDGPYLGCFFEFNIVLPPTYPFSPPKFKFKSPDENMRIHPNLYGSGKVCLSVINTWSGPGWTACNTILSVCNILLGMVLSLKNPLSAEPAYEKININNPKAIYYKELVYCESINEQLINNLKKNMTDFKKEYIKNNIIMYKNLIKHHLNEEYEYKYTPYMYRKINRIIKFNSKNVKSELNKLLKEIESEGVLEVDKRTDIQIDIIGEKLEDLEIDSNTLKFKYIDIDNDVSISSIDNDNSSVSSSSNSSSSSNNENYKKDADKFIESLNNLDIKPPKKYKRKCPKLPAKLFELGTVEISNGDTYEVVEYNRQGNTFKKWKKL